LIAKVDFSNLYCILHRLHSSTTSKNKMWKIIEKGHEAENDSLYRSRRGSGFDVEEESWVETIPVDTKLFKAVCIAEHEEQLCAIGKTRENGVIILKLWKFDMENRRWGPSERLPAPPFPLQGTDRIVKK